MESNSLRVTPPDAALSAIGLPRLTYDVASGFPMNGTVSGLYDLAAIDFNNYDVVLVPSDNLGVLNSQELTILISRREDLRRFVNAGGGIVAFGESGLSLINTPITSGYFGFLSAGISPTPLIGTGAGITVSAAGAPVGLTAADVNGDATYDVFAADPGLDVIDTDSAGRILTLAERGRTLSAAGVVAEEAPSVVAPPLQTVLLSGTAALAGSAASASGAPLSISWSQVSGPGVTTFASAAVASTSASFSQIGHYVLRLSAAGATLTSSADTAVDVIATDIAPVVNAGHDQTIAGLTAGLSGTVTGRSPLTWGWQEVSGPGLASFADASQLNTVVAFSNAGTYVLQLWASDTQLFASSVVVITAQQPVVNEAPFVDVGPNPIYVTLTGGTVQAQLAGTVTDDGLPVNVLNSLWALVSGPAPVQFGDATRPATTATFSAAGTYTLRLSATDTALSNSAVLTVVVLADPRPPPVVSAGSYAPLVYPQLSLQLAGASTALATTWSLRAGDGQAAFDNVHDLHTTVHFSWAGQYVLHLAATDGQLSSFDEVLVTVGAAPGALPVASITSPADGARITTQLEVVGSVSGGQWALEISLDADDSYPHTWTTVASGVSAAAGVLATLDPTQMLNGTYALRLRAITARGTGEDDRSFTLDKNLKVGNFAIAFTDVSIPVTGLPVTVTRAYDSRDPRSGDFGPGWSLAISDLRVEKSGVLGKFWEEQEQGFDPFFTYCLEPLRPVTVSVTFPSGKVYSFQAKTDPECQQFAPIDTPNLSFAPMAGTVGSLQAGEAQPTVLVAHPNGIPGPVQLLDFDGASIYNPSSFVLTIEDGTQFGVGQGTGAQWVQDTNGNRLTFTHDGILSSAGKGVAFIRDAQGRIVQITDPNGASLGYSYDVSGHLIAFTDRSGNTTRFGYDAFGKLASITDALGKQALTNSWTGSRLTASADAAGNAMRFTHDLAGHRETVTDAQGHATSYEYDTDGNVVRLTDALSHVTSSTYDANDNKLSETDALGHTTAWTYDASNNRLSQTDPLGNATRWTYDVLNKPLTTTDPLGHVTSSVRQEIALCLHAQASGNLLSTTDALGNSTSYGYDSCNGNLQSQTDARGGVTTYAYDGAGRVTSTTGALGKATAYTYDANGNQLSETRAGFTTAYQYEASGRRTKVIYPDGNTTQTVYNALGKPASTTDQLGRATSYAYDDQARLTTTSYPDGTTTATAYDSLGRRASSTDRGGRTTSFMYDAVGRLTATTYVDGSSRSTVYDAAGRVTSSVDELGHATTYAYDAAGRRSGVADAAGNTTSFTYDAAGNQLAVTDPLGHSVQYAYDATNRQVKTSYPDGTAEQTQYDALGNRSARIDQAGLITKYAYDALGRLVSVTDALNQVTAYAYDAVGNRIGQTDANGHTTSFAYDSMGRRSSRTLPIGQMETFTYYADGQLKTRTDFNGHSTSYAYDPAGRLAQKTPDAAFSGEPPVTYMYTASGRRAWVSDAIGTTTYAYDARDRLLSKATPAGTLTYVYDTAGDRLSAKSDSGKYDVSYSYDALSRLSAVTDHAGGAAASYSYDAAGRMSAVGYGNGVTTQYVYDALNRVTAVTVGTNLGTTGASVLGSYTYALYPTGNRRSVTEQSGRTASWQYDALWRLTSETIAGGSANGSISYTYDSVGSRLSRTSSVAGVPSTTSTYDDDDRLLSDSWDPNGNTVQSGANQYGYDSENRLLSLNRTAANYVYDGDGQLVSKTVGGVTTTYLIDDQTPAGYTQIAEERVSGAVQKSYVYGPQRISMRDSTGLHYYGYDAHSGVRLLLDSTGTVNDSWDYDAFGTVIRRTGTSDSSFTYRGEQMDSALGLQYLRARWMDPGQGRFWTRDSWEGNIASPESLNPMSFTTDPVDLADPSGHCSDLGGPGLRLCLETYIPFAEVALPWPLSFYRFHGDNRGPSAQSGDSFRTRHFVTNFGTSSARAVFTPGITTRLSDGAQAPGSQQGIVGDVVGRNAIHLAAQSANQLGPPGTPAIHYDLTASLEFGRVALIGDAGQFPAMEAWLYDQSGCPSLVYSYDPRQGVVSHDLEGFSIPLSRTVESIKDIDPKCRSGIMGLPVSQQVLQTGRAIYSGWYTGADLGSAL